MRQKLPFWKNRKKRKENEEKQKREGQVKRKEILQMLKEEIKRLLGQPDLPLEDLLREHKEIKEKFLALRLSGQEKQLFERLLFSLDGMVEDRKILVSPAKETLQEYRERLAQKKKRQAEIKKQLEDYRKTMNASGLDFEKAIIYRELIDREKLMLEKTEKEILEIEEKIDQLLS